MDINPKLQNTHDTIHRPYEGNHINKKAGPSVDASITLKRGNKIIMGGEGIGGKEGDLREAQRARRMNGSMQ